MAGDTGALTGEQRLRDFAQAAQLEMTKRHRSDARLGRLAGSDFYMRFVPIGIRKAMMLGTSSNSLDSDIGIVAGFWAASITLDVANDADFSMILGLKRHKNPHAGQNVPVTPPPATGSAFDEHAKPLWIFGLGLCMRDAGMDGWQEMMAAEQEAMNHLAKPDGALVRWMIDESGDRELARDAQVLIDNPKLEDFARATRVLLTAPSTVEPLVNSIQPKVRTTLA